ncbi:lipoyl(octanoyl) transferase LipB [Sphingomonas tabacisoli]|uniref:Octanoyltransferase n=1 Tax=Sphingomonas tabacisoli TaxID=2249466 RepID=A0ABW4I770_9SPHN
MIDDIEWQVSPGLTDYQAAAADMEARAEAIRAGAAPERIWLLEHAPLYTAGTSADTAELLDPRFPVHKSGRGGRYTYHGPGQRVGYVQLDLDRRGRDIRCFVHELERWVIGALGQLGVAARAVDGRIGIWVDTPAGEAKIGAIGVRVRRWVTLHGFSVNVDPDLDHFTGIVPCGLSEFPVASMASIGNKVPLEALDSALWTAFPGFLEALGGGRKEELLRGEAFVSKNGADLANGGPPSRPNH